MALISLLKFSLTTVLFYAALGYVTFHFFSTLFVFILIFSIGSVCFVSYRKEEEKEKDSPPEEKQGCATGDMQMGGAETLSEEILELALMFLFWGVISGMSQVKNELQKRIDKLYIFLVLLLLASTGLSLGWLLESSTSKFLM
ncbi:hypothetical protein V2H45_03180 [Tumidithrix elongata RA019]|uniref:Uncharacterized protein n=1 Tax=Tumidithrix elongata BACA0141 TaxID=2716417 RepID=A0AAW9PZ74_9CYAN|nr:hypothetical protein [Tumidithrix elongata RA019]